MIRSLRTAVTGMEAQQLNIDVIANNLANVNTVGFKRSRAEFQDMLYEQIRASGNSDGTTGNTSPTNPLEVGQGVMPVTTQKIFSLGNVVQTNNELDIAVEGKGFFQVKLPNGDLAYTRHGVFKRNAEGLVVNSEGHPLEPQLVVPTKARKIRIDSDGTVKMLEANQTEMQEIGKIETVLFVNPAGLESAGHSLYFETEASGTPIEATPGQDGAGQLRQGMLEHSNVSVMEEMVKLITSQRAYEVNSKVIQTADQMLNTTVRIR